MGSKKNIDKFFQEQFKDFEVNPSELVWDNINSELDAIAENQKKPMPLWVKYSGVAALLLLFIIVGKSYFSSSELMNESSVETRIAAENSSGTSTPKAAENGVEKSTKQLNVNVSSDFQGTNTTTSSYKLAVTNSADDKGELSKDGSKEFSDDRSVNNQLKNNSFATHKNQVQLKGVNAGDTGSGIMSKADNVEEQFKAGNDEVLVADARLNRRVENNELSENKNGNKQLVGVENQRGNTTDKAQVTDKFNPEVTNQIKGIKSDSYVNTDVSSESADGSQKLLRNNSNDNVIVASGSGVIAQNEKLGAIKPQQSDDKKQLLGSVHNNLKNDSIAEHHVGQIETALVVNETSDISNGEGTTEEDCVDEELVEELPIEKTIEDAIADQTLNEEVNDESLDTYTKWEIVPNVAPIYYNTLTSGSPIADEFKGNDKKGQFTTSYGIGVSYALNKRLSVRTGVNKLEVGYDTQDVAVYSSPETGGVDHYKNINFSSVGSTLSMVGAGSHTATQIPSSFSSLFDSSLNQRLGYLEVPLELSYKLSDRKLRVDVIAGFSTFFLNKNEIYSENKVKTIYIGEANNLNNMSYSTNLGIGLEYKISKKINFNFDPMFKYQLNAFSNDAGNFKPYILGIYSGISYRF
ncbi:MAG: outer membrane beta-barrel protein [Flavobacteriaceae bacterium]